MQREMTTSASWFIPPKRIFPTQPWEAKKATELYWSVEPLPRGIPILDSAGGARKPGTGTCEKIKKDWKLT